MNGIFWTTLVLFMTCSAWREYDVYPCESVVKQILPFCSDTSKPQSVSYVSAACTHIHLWSPKCCKIGMIGLGLASTWMQIYCSCIVMILSLLMPSSEIPALSMCLLNLFYEICHQNSVCTYFDAKIMHTSWYYDRMKNPHIWNSKVYCVSIFTSILFPWCSVSYMTTTFTWWKWSHERGVHSSEGFMLLGCVPVLHWN